MDIQQTQPESAMIAEPKDSWLSKILLPLMDRRICRAVIIVIFLLILGGSIYVIPLVDVGGAATTYVPDDSPVLDFYHDLEV